MLHLVFWPYLGAKHGQASWVSLMDRVKCSSAGFTLCLQDPPGKSYDEISFSLDFRCKTGNGWQNVIYGSLRKTIFDGSPNIQGGPKNVPQQVCYDNYLSSLILMLEGVFVTSTQWLERNLEIQAFDQHGTPQAQCDINTRHVLLRLKMASWKNIIGFKNKILTVFFVCLRPIPCFSCFVGVCPRPYLKVLVLSCPTLPLSQLYCREEII